MYVELIFEHDQSAVHGHHLFNSPFRNRGMVHGVATTKITITLQDDQLQEIRSLVAAGQAANVSAFVKHAVGVALSDAAGWREMLDVALKETGGPLTPKERTWADSILAPRDGTAPGAGQES